MTRPALTILLAAPRGFCAGVDRAILVVERALERFGAPVYVRHEIVHNRHVVDSLKAKGAVFVDELTEVPDGRPVVFSAHGVPKAVPAAAEARHLMYVDATCPLVSKVHVEAERHFQAGHHILLIGHANHPEVVGTMGQVPPEAMTLIETVADAETFTPRDAGNLAYVTQTTLSVDDTAEIVATLRRRFPSIAAPRKEDICYATTNRQAAVKSIAPQCNAFVVIGAPTSSNSNRLVEVARRSGCTPAMLVESVAEIPWDSIKGTLGLTAGASAPEVLVEEVIAAARQRFDVTVKEVPVTTETIKFSLPAPLAPERKTMAVYTEVSDDDLQAFVAAYDIGQAVGCKGIAEGVENSNYLLQTTKGSFILTLYERRVNPADLPFFLGLMEHLSHSGVRCPVPVKGRDGKSLRTLCGRPAAIVSFLEGMWPRKINVSHCAELGAALAGLHMAGMSYDLKRDNALSLAGWRDLYAKCNDAAEGVEPGLNAMLGNELDHLGQHWPQLMPEADLPAGVIHADLFPDNVFFLNDKCSGLIDFYFACTDFLAYDIVVCMNAWCFEPDGAFNITKASRLFATYQAVRPLTPEEKRALPLLARGACLRFLLTRLYDWVNTPAGAMVKPKDPREYVRKLNFHRGVTDASAYGLN